MGQFCSDSGVNKAIEKLVEELGTYSRSTGNDTILMIIPADPREKIVAALNDRPYPEDMVEEEPQEILFLALKRRNWVVTEP